MISKYGSPFSQQTFPGRDKSGERIGVIFIEAWDLGKTEVFLIRCEYGLFGTEVSVVYFSKDIFEEIKGTIQSRINIEQNMEQQRKKERAKQDLRKIQ